MADQKSADIWMTLFLHYLRLGLSRFAGQCKVAAVASFSSVGKEPLSYDPDGLLKIDDLPIDGSYDPLKVYEKTGVIVTHNTNPADPQSIRLFALPARNSDAFVFIQTWLNYSTNFMFNVYRMSLVARPAVRLAMEQLQHFAPMVVTQLVCDKLNLDAGKPTFPIAGTLEAIARISRTIEEGHAPKGKLIVPIKTDALDLQFLDGVPLLDAKHCGKLLALTKTDGMLVSDASNILGITKQKTSHYLLASFTRGGVLVSCEDEPLCHIVGGELRSRQKPHQQVIEEITSDNKALKDAAKLAGSIAKSAAGQGFGCTLVLDPSEKPAEITGHALKTSASVGHLDLICGMASVDGAIQIDSKGNVTSFGCLLDGETVGTDEVRSRGARYNSALRFSAKKGNEKLCVVVVSADGPMTVFYKGKEQYSDPWAKPLISTEPPMEPWQGTPVKSEGAKITAS